MKKLLLVAALLLFPLFASAGVGDTLLTPEGTLYALNQQAAADSSNIHLVLTISGAGDIRREVVPATLADGTHTNASMAYDPQSQTLFVFWLRQIALFSSQLMVTSLDASGAWSEAIEFGQPFDYRENLCIAVTRKVVGDHAKLEAGLSVHATWWELDMHSGVESARYAILGVENGKLSDPEFLDLTAGLSADGAAAPELTAEERAVLRHPMLDPSPKQESVLVTFGNLQTGRFHRMRVYPLRPPATDGRIRIPVGRGEGSIGAPRFEAAANSTVDSVHGADGDSLALYTQDKTNLRYVLYRDGKWSDARSIMLDAEITASSAVEAIRRLVNDN